MTVQEAKVRRGELIREQEKLEKFIIEEETKECLSNLKDGHYYKYQHSSCSYTYFQFNDKCVYRPNELGDALIIGLYATVEHTRMDSTYMFGSHGTILLNFNNVLGSFEEITKEEFINIFKYITERCEECTRQAM